MPEIDVVLYKEDEDTVPLRDWLRGLTPKASALSRLTLWVTEEANTHNLSLDEALEPNVWHE